MNRAPRSVPLLISIALLSAFAISNLLGLRFVSANAGHYGEFTLAVQAGRVIGAVFGTFLYFGLAYAQWRKGGTWGFGIGLFAIVIFFVQSGLMYLAVNSGRVVLSPLVIAKFIAFTVLGAGGLAVSSFASYARLRGYNRDTSS